MFLILFGCVVAWFASCRKPPAEAEAPDSLPSELVTEPDTASEPAPQAEEVPSRPPPKPVVRNDADFQAGSVDDVQLVRLFVDGFTRLPARNRALVYHLARAVLAGREIAHDQIHRDTLQIRHLVENIHASAVVTDPDFDRKLSDTMQLLSIHGGQYDRFSGRKWIPTFSYDQFQAAMQAANAVGTDLKLDRSEPLEAQLARLKKVMFDPDYQPVLTPNEPAAVQDVLRASLLNLYNGVSTKDLRDFKEKYPHNARLLRIDGRLMEEVYRSGDKRRKLPPGRYADELRRIIHRLYDAVSVADRPYRQLLTPLIEHFRSGDPAAFLDFLERWQSMTGPVEFVQGFLDREADPRKIKGVYAGLVALADAAASSRLSTLSSLMAEGLNRLPGTTPEAAAEGQVKPDVRAVELVVSAGRLGPLCDFAYQGPAPFAEPAAGKMLLFSNVITAFTRAVALPLAKEFIPPDRRESVLASLADGFWSRVAMLHLALHPAFAARGGNLGRLRELEPTLRFLRAELISLWMLKDPKLVEMGLMSGKAASEAMTQFAISEAVVEQALGLADPVEPRKIARRIWIRYMLEQSGAIQWVEVDGKRLPILADPDKFQQGLEKLIRRVEQLLGSGNRGKALQLIHRFGSQPTWTELGPLAERARALGLHRLVAYVNPKLAPGRDVSGRVADASMSFSESFERQVLRYARY